MSADILAIVRLLQNKGNALAKCTPIELSGAERLFLQMFLNAEKELDQIEQSAREEQALAVVQVLRSDPGLYTAGG